MTPYQSNGQQRCSVGTTAFADRLSFVDAKVGDVTCAQLTGVELDAGGGGGYPTRQSQEMAKYTPSTTHTVELGSRLTFALTTSHTPVYTSWGLLAGTRLT